MSQLIVDDIVNRNEGAPGFSKGLVVTGICTASIDGNASTASTASGLSGTSSVNTTGIITAASAEFTGVTIGASGIQLGGTGTLNNLDDYEEGTWTPALSSDWTSVTYTIQRGRYIKIGNLVYIYYTLQMSAATSPGSGYAFSILNIPFQGYDYLAGYFGGGVSGSNIDSFVSDNWTTVFYGGAGTSFTFNDQGGNTSLRCGSNITSTAHGYISGWLIYSADTFV